MAKRPFKIVVAVVAVLGLALGLSACTAPQDTWVTQTYHGCTVRAMQGNIYGTAFSKISYVSGDCDLFHSSVRVVFYDGSSIIPGTTCQGSITSNNNPYYPECSVGTESDGSISLQSAKAGYALFGTQIHLCAGAYNDGFHLPDCVDASFTAV